MVPIIHESAVRKKKNKINVAINHDSWAGQLVTSSYTREEIQHASLTISQISNREFKLPFD